MALIREMILVTTGEDGVPHIAPLGLIEDGGLWIAAPFKPSRTLDNLLAHPRFTANVPGDVRIFAGCLTGRKAWPTLPAKMIDGFRLADAVSHFELEVAAREDDGIRPRFRSRILHEASHRPAPGFNRAEGAVIEAAILASRLDRLPVEKIRAEMDYLRIAVSKTAGPREAEAWEWLTAHVEAHLAAITQPMREG